MEEHLLPANGSFPMLKSLCIKKEVKTRTQLADAGDDVNDIANLRKDTPSIVPDVHSEEDDTEVIRGAIYLPYKHREWVPGCHPHPANIVEPASLAAVETQVHCHDISKTLAPTAIAEGRLSSLQLESIILAAQRHRLVLPSGERAGFFIGDAAGVGKGRQIAGVIMDNYCRGRKKHIWFSVSTDLIIDARRDLKDIGCYVNVINGCQEIEKETKLFGCSEAVKSGVVFSTYSTIVSSFSSGGGVSRSRKSRLQQLVEWCGGADFDGCLVFDECHKAKHFVPGKESTSSKVALAICSIQKQLPRARVLYCSATGVTDVKNMAFMERMGLWGETSPFKSYEHFLDIVQRKGLGVAEMLAMDMKRDGSYLSRMLSFADAEFVPIECSLTDDQRVMYNMATLIWNEIRKSLEAAVHRCCLAKSRAFVNFWASHQRFFSQLCMSMKVDTVVRMVQQALKDGLCVVIGLQNTGEATLTDRLEKDGFVSGFVSTCREIMLNFLEQHFPVCVEQALPPSGKDPPVVIDEWSSKTKSLLIGYAKQLNLYDCALDVLIDKLGGPSKVAEMTGRKGRITRHSPDAPPQYELRHLGDRSDQSLNVQERNLFMCGKKLVAIISDAASTGISLHADTTCENTRRRLHITLQLPWSAEKAVQQLGRSHRSNQKSAPLYQLLSTELGGERRFAASVARRLQSLGALTKGDRRAASVADLSQFDYDTLYGRNALKLMLTHIMKGELPLDVPLERIVCGMPAADFITIMRGCLVTMGLLSEAELEAGLPVSDSDQRDVNKFLNRILGLQVLHQNMIFRYFTACLEVTIALAKKEGKFNEGFVDLTGNSIQLLAEPKHVFSDLCSGCRHMQLIVDRGLPWEGALQRLESLGNGHPDAGFYRSKNDMHGRYFYLLITPKENSDNCFKVARPNTGVGVQELDVAELRHKYLPISTVEAEVLWKKVYVESLTTCNHGKQCSNEGTCQVGKRRYHVNIVCGSLLRILPLLEDVLMKNSVRFKLSKHESSVKVVRVCLDGGERLVGFQFPLVLMPAAELAATAMSADLQSRGTNLHCVDKLENVSDVIEKLVRKASQPPRTLRTYFSHTTQRSPVTELERKAICHAESEDVILVTSVQKRARCQSRLDNFFTKKSKTEVANGRPNQIFNCPNCAATFDDLNAESKKAHVAKCNAICLD